LPNWCKLEPCLSIYKKYRKPEINIGNISDEIEKTCPEDFGRELVDKKLSIDKPVILIEGYTIYLPKIRAAIVRKLRERNVYIWNLTREA